MERMGLFLFPSGGAVAQRSIVHVYVRTVYRCGVYYMLFCPPIRTYVYLSPLIVRHAMAIMNSLAAYASMMSTNLTRGGGRTRTADVLGNPV